MKSVCLSLALLSSSLVIAHCKEKESTGILFLGGVGAPGLALVAPDGKECVDADLPDIPQEYGDPGRVGGVASYDPARSRVVFCGGLDSSPSPPFSSFRDCQVLDLKSKKWLDPSPAPQLPEPLSHSAYATTADGMFVVAGGHHQSNPKPGPTKTKISNRIYVLDLANIKNGWKELNTRLPANASNLCGTARKNEVFIVGEKNINGRVDLKADEWSDIPSVEISDAGCLMDIDEFGESHMYLIGGRGKDAGAVIKRLDIKGGKEWQTNEFLKIAEPRPERPAVAQLANGNLVIAGGSEVSLSSEELTEEGWDVHDEALRSPRSGAAAVVVDMKFFPECT